MAELAQPKRADSIQRMFTRIARRYDFMNRLMTGGQDIRWRKHVIALADLKPGARLLDIGAGTGDLSREALKQQPEAQVVSADFTLEMMRVGQKNGNLPYSAADALCLPFEDDSFDAAVSGFLMRNVTDIHKALQEQYRVLKPRGRIVILDTTRPKRHLLSPLIWLYMHVIIPVLGRLLSGTGDAYQYLPESTENFVTAEKLASLLAAVGFRKVGFERLMFGAIAIHWAEK
jgi:demethylmenaquinone methyltransferase/2-methoxy-6-polyprenyl-1,4-benzoquinol methylase